MTSFDSLFFPTFGDFPIQLMYVTFVSSKEAITDITLHYSLCVYPHRKVYDCNQHHEYVILVVVVAFDGVTFSLLLPNATALLFYYVMHFVKALHF